MRESETIQTHVSSSCQQLHMESSSVYILIILPVLKVLKLNKQTLCVYTWRTLPPL